MRRPFPLLVALALLCGPAALALAGSDPAERSWEDYQVLMERNIFSRARGPRPARQEQPQRQEEAPPPRERFLILRGVIRRGGQFIAIVEDMSAGSTMHVRREETLLNGHISEITLNGITYTDAEGRELNVLVGKNLDGAAAVPAADPDESPEEAPPAATPDESPEEAPPADDAPEDEDTDILERLRQRRMRELGQ